MYKEPLLLFHHIGKTLENVSASAGPAFGEAYAARGLALGDFNNDGAMDVLVSVNNGSPVLLKKRRSQRESLARPALDREAVQPRRDWRENYVGLKRSQQKVGGGSYLSSHDPRVLLGLGPRRRIDKLEIRWPQPSERVDIFKDVPVDRYVTIVEGTGLKY
jgi:hypothetical protein